MTHPSNDHDRDLKELFREARSAETRRAPAFETLLTRNDRGRPWKFEGRRLLAIGFSTAVLASLALFGMSWVLVPRFDSGTVQTVLAVPQAAPPESAIAGEA